MISILDSVHQYVPTATSMHTTEIPGFSREFWGSGIPLWWLPLCLLWRQPTNSSTCQRRTKHL